MSDWPKHIFGYWNAVGVPKKVVKVVYKIASDSYLQNLVVIEYDMPFMHYTLHNTQSLGKSTRYQLQVQEDWEYIFGPEDRDKLPDIIQLPLPDFRSLTSIHPLQYIPIWASADDERNLYPEMTEGEVRRNSANMADFRTSKYDRFTPGWIELCLVPEGAIAPLQSFEKSIRGRHGENIRLWRLYGDVKPSILCYMIQKCLP